jgi:muconolactone delta-isomerase
MNVRAPGFAMEYLVTMTTHVPDGTPDTAVQDIRTREAAHSLELAAEGHPRRLWRPPLQPGEWRTLGLFEAADTAELEEVLASMPLRVWRTDAIQPLFGHPNDPGRLTDRGGPVAGAGTHNEFFTTFTPTTPPDAPTENVDSATAREADRARELAQRGTLLRLWTLADEGHALGLWRAHDAAQMQAILASLPLTPWLRIETIPLAPHPNDPGLANG